jgi:crossover junction endodeoxyribonuclease RuvC
LQSLIEEPTQIILGIDIGTNVMGLGLIKTNVKNMEFIDMKELFLDRISDEKLKVKTIFKVILDIIESYSPNELVIESPFIGQNLQSSIKTGITQGIIIAAALYKNILLFEYSTRKIKIYLTGYGNATKEQVAKMLKKLLNLEQLTCYNFDASDAIAVAACHYICKVIRDIYIVDK